MTSDILQAPQEVAQLEEARSLEDMVARSLGLESQKVRLIKIAAFTSEEKDRFLYGLTEPDDSLEIGNRQPAGFFKMSHTPELVGQLRRESDATIIANKIGIPSIRVLHPFQLTSEGYGLFHLERLDTENGEFLATEEMVAVADRSFGARAAKAFALTSGRPIPSYIDSSSLRRDSARNESFETFFKVWEEKYDLVFGGENSGLDSGLMDRVQRIVGQTRSEIEPIIQSSVHPDVEYFVHNDAAINNVFFQEDGEVLFLDFEHAAATHNLFLAQLTDSASYYGRMWPNPEMQQEFLTTYLEGSSPDSLDYNYQLMKATVVFGSIYHASYVMKVGHREHAMAESLLINLENNLSVLDQKYDAMKMPVTT